MDFFYEFIKRDSGFPFKVFIHSVDEFEMHYHNEMEMILVLSGSIEIKVENKTYISKENDVFLINKNEMHSINRTREDNILLALQIDLEYFSQDYPQINNMVFDCKSSCFERNNRGKFDLIRKNIAQIVWILNKKRKGYELEARSEIYLILSDLVRYFDYYLGNRKKGDSNKAVRRVKEIVEYINENLNKDIDLKKISDTQNISIPYLSHLIKNNLGISFKEYLDTLRLNKALSLLTNTNKTITDISYSVGFPSVKSFNNSFKKIFKCSPTGYRKRNVNELYLQAQRPEAAGKHKKGRTYLDVDREAALKKLFSYLDLESDTEEDYVNITGEKEIIKLNDGDKGTYFKHYWEKLITFTRASEGLREDWQKQFKILQKEIGFKYIRFHGIFSDDMMICNLDENCSIVYNWNYVDKLFDFFKKVNIKPFIEFGFMPSEIKKSDETMFWWKANVSQPKDIRLWINLVTEFLKHCINRYGLKEVEKWYFEVWNEPEFEYIFWVGSKEEYFKFYEETARAVKSVSENLRIGGPSITYMDLTDKLWMDDFLTYCVRNDVPLDFISIHIYPESYGEDINFKDTIEKIKRNKNKEEFIKDLEKNHKIYLDKDHTYYALKLIEERIKKNLSYRPEIHVTEWNASSYSRNFIHDTCFVSTFIIHNILKCMGKADSMGYWTFTDINEEQKAGISEFHGGFGLVTNNGLKKPSYFAYYLLSKLGDEIVRQGEDYIITRKDKDVQILAYNYAYFDDLFLHGDTSALTKTNRYNIYEENSEKEILVSIRGLSGYYKITEYQLNRKKGSVFDQWVNMGAPENMNREELEYLKGKSFPQIKVKYLKTDGKFEESIHLPVHGVEMITLEYKL
ncbi:GH39 family glycosyl hydrolase [Sporanaerobacter sp. PP17-6a]|uniref:GH39 family glycosyl hydrolase n=1 Tax=Sporanaerobacter sp. PP17-6a TaxID=1891289 RepID=UPI0008A063C7|nr:helix-turn-helix domain-containing protein [Sporanaerobacter sp. PP17-6a]SCL89522.1 Beta-xylosidase [Sporanaerobacter sp. PP17-6a]